MCGGIGTRLWPMSRPSRPKQFVPFFDNVSLFSSTVRRVIGIEDYKRLIVVTGSDQLDWVEDQLEQIGVTADIVLEPEGRDSAPAVAAAAVHIQRLDPDGIAVITASDHHIPDGDHFAREIGKALDVARQSRIVTLGIQPTEPSSAYGYIKPAQTSGDVADVDMFVEKPDIETASDYINEGYLWNSGNFIAKAETLVQEFERQDPDVLKPVILAYETALVAGDVIQLGDAFREARKISVDFSIMEGTKLASVLKSDLQWSDVGAWNAVHAVQAADDAGNTTLGDTFLFESKNCNIRTTDNRLVVLSNVSDINVVVDDDVILVSDLKQSQAVKEVVDRLKADGHSKLDLQTSQKTIAQWAAKLTVWLSASALPVWSSMGFDTESGLWRENLDVSGNTAASTIRARVQGRQNYVLALAAKNNWPGNWRAVFNLSDAGIRSAYIRSDGLLRTLVRVNGESADDTALLYDQTFMQLAMLARIGLSTKPTLRTQLQSAPTPHALQYHALSPPDAASADTGFAEASATFQSFPDAPVLAAKDYDHLVMEAFEERDFGGSGLFTEAGSHKHLANPVMHSLEVALVGYEAFVDEPVEQTKWKERASRIANFALKKMVSPDNGSIVERFDEAWRPMAIAGDHFIEPGHQFEWAWLFVKWSRISNYKQFLSVARRLYDVGMKGRNPSNGAIIQHLNAELERVEGPARLWAQSEWVRASLILFEEADKTERSFYKRQIKRSLAVLYRYLETETTGFWHDKMRDDGTFVDEPSPASSLYHIATAIEQIKETAQRFPDI